MVDDNHIYNNTVGIFVKDGTNSNAALNSINTYTRNWLTGNTNFDFLGNNQAGPATYYIYDNVIGSVALHADVVNSEIYNNLILGGVKGDEGNLCGFANGYPSIGGTVDGYMESLWNNIVITSGQALDAYWDPYNNFSVGQSKSPLAYMDYNVYDATSSYRFGDYASGTVTYTLSQFQAQGFEQHSYDISGDQNIFQNLTTYTLLPQWTTAGRYGDTVGPRYSVAQILNPNRYGPGALST